jgi:hypothetical protein
MKCFFRYKGLESQPQSAMKMLNMQTVCSSRENNKELTIHCALDWSALFLLDHDSPRRCCLWNEVTPTEGVLPLPHSLYSAYLYI